MTGSVTAIKPDKLNKGLITNAQDMMTGKIAGVSVISKGGASGRGRNDSYSWRFFTDCRKRPADCNRRSGNG